MGYWEFFPSDKAAGVNTIHLHLLLKLRIWGTFPLLPHTFSKLLKITNFKCRVCSSETLVTTYKITKHHNPKDQNLNSDHQINLKSDSRRDGAMYR
jgi:hypothetical protein